MVRCGAVVLIVLALAGCGGHARPKVVKARSLPGSIVEADGHRVYFDCEGKGSPTIVLLNGWSLDLFSWSNVFDRFSRLTRTCEYDRYGVGLTAEYGELPPRARDGHDQIRELEQLLRNASIPKPYVLVGHSWGGSLARLYAGTHDGVEGVVFIDSSLPGQIAALARPLPPKRPGEPPIFELLRHPNIGNALLNPEHLAWSKSLNETGDVKSLGDRPIVVVTAGQTFDGAERYVAQVWIRLQNRLAALSSRSIHVLAPTSSHSVQVDEPTLVLAAVRAVVVAARDDGRLAACAAVFRGVAAAKCLS